MFASLRRAPFVILPLALACCTPVAKNAPAPAITAPSVPVAPPPPRGEPVEFAGAPTAKLKGMLGEPAFMRKEGTGEIWRYDGAGCHAFFFLFSDAVRHVETLPRGTAGAADPACLSGLQKIS